MQINMEKKDGVSVFRLVGNIDISSSPDVKKHFDKEIDDANSKVVINLTDVDYVDSSGLATLVEILKKARSYGGGLKLTNLSTKVKGLFEITKLDKLFQMLESEDEAVSSF